MRIISGALKGRKLARPKGPGVRPTTDRVREALFQILESSYGVEWQGSSVLDLFAGSGALGIEALSRGADHAVFVEQHRQAAALAARNIEQCGLIGRAELLKTDVFRLLKSGKAFQAPYRPFSVIFADPPYGKGISSRLLDAVSQRACSLQKGALFVVEESRKTGLERRFKGGCVSLDLQERRVYGDTAIFFYTVERSLYDKQPCPE